MLKVLLSFTLSLVLLSCSTRHQVIPLESSTSSKSESMHYLQDTLHLVDSVVLYQQGDTVRLREVRYRDRYIYRRDTLTIRDTVRTEVPVEVEVVREVNRLSPLQKGFMWLGVLALALALITLAKRFIH